MQVAIPPEFERFAQEQVKAGAVVSEEEAVAIVMRDYLADLRHMRAMVDEGFASIDRGEGVDGEPFMREFLAETKAFAQAE